MSDAGAPNGASGDSRDGVETPSRIAESFFGREVQIPPGYGPFTTPLQIYYGGAQTFHVRFGESFTATMEVWTTEEGVERMIGALQAALVRARIAGIPEPVVFDYTEPPF